MSGPYEIRLTKKLTEAFSPQLLQIDNESPMHGLPKSAEKHFRVVLVSEGFAGKTRVARHRLVHDILAQELSEHVHALSVQAFTPVEWQEREGKTASSPQCLGGSKHEKKF